MDDLLQEMIDPAPAPRDRPRRRRLWTTVVIVGLAALGVTSLTTSALFSDQEKSGAQINTGSLDLKTDQSLDFTVPFDNMLPGAQVVAPITIKNDGSLAFAYSVSAAASDDPTTGNPDLGNGDDPGTGVLRTKLHLDLFKVGTADCTLAGVAGRTPVGGSAGTWGIPGTATLVLGTTHAADAANPRVDAGDTTHLCARVSFDEAAGNEFQNTASTVTLTFDAMQLTFDPADPDPSHA
ncbi:TasA family protein [Cellulomonas sp. HZM]|uniref:TasA family protein n=1 Tax=Cellulomonas sp. HZM TaxID=1454010 RepID=UPI0004937D94|nr:TasA family protein [Cellulomonas sp. HZM]